MLIQATALAIPLADQSVHCVICSPPYWGLREYLADDDAAAHLEIGSEATPEAYISNMLAFGAEVWRVLRDDGTFWLNLGDSYARDPGKGEKFKAKNGKHKGGQNPNSMTGPAIPNGLKPKDLVGMPWRVALALQAAGWTLRADVIWSKPNPMPESVTDRPTKAHEYVFLFSKRERYFYDADAVREEHASEPHTRGNGKHNGRDDKGKGSASGWTTFSDGTPKPTFHNPAGRNRRSVWTIATEPYSGAHFATYPPALIAPCIMAGTSAKGVCPQCGAPWVRLVDSRVEYDHVTSAPGKTKGGPRTRETGNGAGTHDIRHGVMIKSVTTGWRPSCHCDKRGNIYQPGDFDLIKSPTGDGATADPTKRTGRKGMNRTRAANEGQRPITRYQQRIYAAQLKASPNRDAMAQSAGKAFDHYTRTDKIGARPIPADLLEQWIAAGWLERVDAPERQPFDPVPATVLDPFNGSGTTGQVAREHGRRYIGLDISATYLQALAMPRAENLTSASALAELPLFKGLA